MSPFLVSCLWCVLQISLLCAVGVVLSLLVARRYAASSAAVMSATAGVILVATVLTPIQIPHWNLPQSQVTEVVAAPAVPTSVETDGVDTNAKNSNGAFVDFGALLARMRSATAPAGTIAKQPSIAVRCVTIIVALGIAVGLLRLGGAFWAVWQIRRGSVLMDGGVADRELKSLARTMDCRFSVRVATSAEVESAAVIGWLRPLVVLPMDWETWPLEQMRAVLAHELAHIVRRDYLWRAVGTIARAVHFYHPLAHWLLGRLTVSQEVAADQLAAQALGSRSKYLKALSCLALRQDDRLLREPILMPTSSSHLMRRIEMLRTKERTQNRGLNVVVRAVAVGAVMLLAVATTALRGLAEPKEDSTPTAAVQTESIPNTANEMFKYPPIDPAIIGDNEQGVFLLRVAEMLKQDSIKPMIGMINQMVSAECKTWFGSSELVEIDLRTIDYIAGQSNVVVRRREPDPEREHNSQLMIGSDLWVVRFKRDISDWKEWIRAKAPEAEEMQHGEITYFQFPPIPAMGPQGIQVAARDSHTLVFSGDSEDFWDQVEGNQLVPARWADEWKELDGGLISVIATDKSFEVSVENSKVPGGNAMNQVADNIQQIGFGIDWDPLTDQVSVKMNSCCSSQEKAELVKTAIVSLMSLSSETAKAGLEKKGQDDPDSGAARNWQLVSELLNNFESQTATKQDGTVVVHVKTSFGLSLEEMIQELFTGEKEVASREPAEGKLK